MSSPSDEAREARQQAEDSLSETAEREQDAAEKLADAVRAVARLRSHQRADVFVAMVQRALERASDV
jgi:hypothetical protein